MPSIDTHATRRDLAVGRKKYAYYSLAAAEEAGLTGISRLPRSMKVLLENLLRNEDGVSVTAEDLKAVAAWVENKGSVEHEIAFRPARVLMQDFTGVPAVVDPVMVAKGGASLLEEAAIDAVRTLMVPRAALLTPNAPEAEALTGIPVTDLDGQRRAGEALHGTLGIDTVVQRRKHIAGKNDARYRIDAVFVNRNLAVAAH